MALKEGWKISENERDNICAELTYIADFIQAGLGPGPIARRELATIRARVLDMANRIAVISCEPREEEDEHASPSKRPSAGRGAKARARKIAASPDSDQLISFSAADFYSTTISGRWEGEGERGRIFVDPALSDPQAGGTKRQR